MKPAGWLSIGLALVLMLAGMFALGMLLAACVICRA